MSSMKKVIIFLVIIGTLVGAGYGLFRLYTWAIEDATKRIQSGVAKGIGKGLGDTLNPFKIFGSK